MNIQEQIEHRLQTDLSPLFLEVLNESGNHNVPAGSESHFKVTIVSDAFDCVPLIQRHRKINNLLAEFLAGPVHALALHVYNAQEWQNKNNLAPSSPDCRG